MLRAAVVALVAFALPAGAREEPVESPEAMIHRLCRAGCAFMTNRDADKLQANLNAIRARLIQIEQERAAEIEARKTERCT